MKQSILWGHKRNEPDYFEHIITEKSELIEQASIWALSNGFDLVRIQEFNLNVKPNFINTLNKTK